MRRKFKDTTLPELGIELNVISYNLINYIEDDKIEIAGLEKQVEDEKKDQKKEKRASYAEVDMRREVILNSIKEAGENGIGRKELVEKVREECGQDISVPSIGYAISSLKKKGKIRLEGWTTAAKYYPKENE